MSRQKTFQDELLKEQNTLPRHNGQLTGLPIQKRIILEKRIIVAVCHPGGPEDDIVLHHLRFRAAVHIQIQHIAGRLHPAVRAGLVAHGRRIVPAIVDKGDAELGNLPGPEDELRGINDVLVHSKAGHEDVFVQFPANRISKSRIAKSEHSFLTVICPFGIIMV